MRSLIITLDGPAGSGKSTLARQLAKRLGLEFLDTGAMYRGLAALVLEAAFDPGALTVEAIEAVRRADLGFDWEQQPPALFVNGRDVTGRIRDLDVTKAASQIAAHGQVRQVLVAAQRKIGVEHPRLVTEGRDQGSVVFPDATVKFYMDARAKVRAQRRVAQLREAGKAADEAQILKDIIERDERDSTRADGPLVRTPDAILIDTSDITPEQVLAALIDQVVKRASDRLDPAVLPGLLGHLSQAKQSGQSQGPTQ